jgi:hypothetical protein
MARLHNLRQQLARQFTADMVSVLLECGDEVIEAARANKSLEPTEIERLTNFLKLAKAKNETT